MRRSVLGIAIGGAVLALAGALLTPAGAAIRGSGSALGVFEPAAGATIPVQGGSTSSLNWSGYAVTPPAHDVTAVSSTFQVPTAGLVPPGFDAMWTGIGGYSTTDLIQAGIGAQSLPSAPLLGPQYYAWYEILPASETPITGCAGDSTCAVSPGDTITVDISKGSGSDWNVSINNGSKWSFTKTLQYQSSESSAEWIFEAPTLVAAQTIPAPVNTAHFLSGETYSDGSGTHTITQGSPTAIDMGLGVGINEATPSALGADGQSFNVCTYSTSCPAP